MNAEFDELVQVAGVIDQAEADMLVRSGVLYLGFPLRLAVAPRGKPVSTAEENGPVDTVTEHIPGQKA